MGEVCGKWLILVFPVLWAVMGCGNARYYHFEELGGFEIPASFEEHEFVQVGAIEILKGKMDTTDAKRLVKDHPAFKMNIHLEALRSGDIFDKELTSHYTLRAADEERDLRFHLNVVTGEVEATVVFSSGRGAAGTWWDG